jgi:hypothetical protein
MGYDIVEIDYISINSPPSVILTKAEVEAANARRFPISDLAHCVLGALDLQRLA